MGLKEGEMKRFPDGSGRYGTKSGRDVITTQGWNCYIQGQEIFPWEWGYGDTEASAMEDWRRLQQEMAEKDENDCA